MWKVQSKYNKIFPRFSAFCYILHKYTQPIGLLKPQVAIIKSLFTATLLIGFVEHTGDKVKNPFYLHKHTPKNTRVQYKYNKQKSSDLRKRYNVFNSYDMQHQIV